LIPLVNDLQVELRRLFKLLSVGDLSIFDLNQNEKLKITADKNQPEGLFFQVILFSRPENKIRGNEFFKLPAGDILN